MPAAAGPAPAAGCGVLGTGGWKAAGGSALRGQGAPAPAFTPPSYSAATAESKSSGGSKGVLISFCETARLSVPKRDLFPSAAGAGSARPPLPPRLLMEAGAPLLVRVFGLFGERFWSVSLQVLLDLGFLIPGSVTASSALGFAGVGRAASGWPTASKFPQKQKLSTEVDFLFLYSGQNIKESPQGAGGVSSVALKSRGGSWLGAAWRRWAPAPGQGSPWARWGHRGAYGSGMRLFAAVRRS